MIFIDGDFPTGKKCKYHCSPTCHPGQVDYAAAPDLAEEVVRLRRLLKECADRAVVLYCADRCDFTEVGKESCRHVGGCEEMRKYRAAIEGGRE